ncbi:LuxR C-terminal-related transcriptional regulator [Leptolyngbya sp. NK1-12]
MSLLTQKDLRDLLKFLRELYILYNLEEFPNYVISLIPKIVSSDLTGFSPINYKKFSLLVGSISRSIDHLNVEQVAQQHFCEHPHNAYYLQTGDGKACKISDFWDEDQLHCSEGLYHKFLQPLGLEDQMGLILPTSQLARKKLPRDLEPDMTLSLHRTERSFSERDRLVLNLLRPHIFQAYQNAQALTQMQQELARLERIIEQSNMIILTADGVVDLMSQQAWTLLKQYFQLPHLPSARLPERLHQWVKSQIASLTQTSDIPSPRLPLRLEWQGQQLLIRLITDQSGEQYLLLLEEQTASSLSSKSIELLGLTKREAEVLSWVTLSKSNAEIADILGISELTVKKHLEHIYQKFGVQGRIAAVTYALDKLGVLRA